MFFESSLEATRSPGSFLGNLNRLRELNIEYCKIRYVPSQVLSSLRDLRSLTMRTHNSDWSAMNLEFHPESFHGLTELRNLDLADNNIWSLPTEVFCPMYSLRVLNLTGNRLNDISQLGFSDWGNGPSAPGKACNTGLEVLDVSFNDVTMLPDNGLSALRSLQTLLLQDNLLTSLADRSFVGLGALKVLNISSNRIMALPPDLFQSSRRIHQIHLQNNSLTVLAPGLFEGLDRLEELDLSLNELTSAWVNRDTFAGLVRLVVLNLGHNGLAKIDNQVFRGLYSLQILNLEHNGIEFIAEMAFSDLKNLHALTLSHNKLKSVEPFHLSELFVLHQLLLDSNLIETIHDRSFENLTHLNDLSLNDNFLDEIPSGLGRMRFLKSLDLGKNKISIVKNSSFEGLEELLGLRLVDNFITNISRDAFITLSSLHVLNLASNQIKHIDQSAFSSNPTIRAIRLDNNQIEDISSVFTSLPALVFLNVSDNNIRWFDYSHLPVSLEWLDMHKNNISELGNYFEVRNGIQMKMLDVSFNQLTSIDDTSIPDSIETIFLNNNQITEVASGTFIKKRSIEKVVLHGNKLKRLDIGAFALSPVSESREMPQFYISDNPIHCDCNMEWLQRINELSHLRQHPRVLDLDQVMCTMDHSRAPALRPLMDLKTQDFLCKYENHCFALCHCCDFDACDCKMTCPDGCSCYHDPAWSTNVVDCGNAGYNEVPQIPMDATTVYLDGNDLGDLGSHVFIGKKKLENLYLNNSNVGSIHNRTFNGLPSLKILHLENNNLKELHGFEFDQLRNLKDLFVNHNAISEINNNSFTSLDSLEILGLNDNKVVDFVPWQETSRIPKSVKSVNMDGNMWNCECDNLISLSEWFKLSGIKSDLNKLICVDERIVGDALADCKEYEEVPEATSAVQRTILNDKDIVEYVPLLSAVLFAIVGTLILMTLVCVFRQELRLWVHARYGIRLCKDPTIPLERNDDNEKLYDGYMVYSAADGEFISRDIASELEQEGYSLCLHHRDIHSTAFLADSLQSASDASRKILLVLSMNFLQMEWADPHFRVALQAVLELIRPSCRRHKLVLILTAPSNVVAMDPIMDILLRTCTVIYWGDKKFWEKLRYAMPDVVGLRTKIGKPDLKTSPNLRYTPAPTSVDIKWYRQPYPGIPVQLTQHHLQHQHNNQQQLPQQQQQIQLQTPSQSTYNTEDEMSSASSQHYEQSLHPNYRSRSTASLGHVYSTIPETPPLQGQQPQSRQILASNSPALGTNINNNTNNSPAGHNACFV